MSGKAKEFMLKTYLIFRRFKMFETKLGALFIIIKILSLPLHLATPAPSVYTKKTKENVHNRLFLLLST